MPPINANQTFVLFAKETTFGSPVSDTKDLGLVQSITPTDNVMPTHSNSLGASAIQALDWGRHEIGLRIEADFQHGRLLELLTGGTVTHTQSGATADWSHAFALADSLPSATIGVHHDLSTDAVSKYEGCVATSGTLSMDVNGILKIGVDFAAESVVTSTTAGTKVISTLKPFKAHQAILQTGVISSEATLADVQRFEFTINNIASGDARVYKLGSRLPSFIDMQQRLMSFRFSVAYANLTEYKRMLSGSGASGTSPTDDDTAPTLCGLVFSANNGVAAGSGRQDININLSNVLYTNISRPMQVGNWVLAEIEGIAQTLDSLDNYDTLTSSTF